jgi:hypothetical protein
MLWQAAGGGIDDEWKQEITVKVPAFPAGAFVFQALALHDGQLSLGPVGAMPLERRAR